MKTTDIKINGIVQGVGFRPFVHRLAADGKLKGWIRNTAQGAQLQIQGCKEETDRFLKALVNDAPALASIEDVIVEELDIEEEFEEFSIIESSSVGQRRTLISPDVAICPDCRRELKDPQDRRYGYPFINCTNCGPRFTIIRDVPYDRKNTSMAAFPMCPECKNEYENIEDRRYHAQPDCCDKCGPKLEFILNERCPQPYVPGESQLKAAEGNQVGSAVTSEQTCGEETEDCGEKAPNGEETPRGDELAIMGEETRIGRDVQAIKQARALLKAGKILAVKGIGGIHLACLAENEAAVNELRRRKQRDDKPFAIMCKDVETARKFCTINVDEEKVLEGSRRPIVLLEKKQPGTYEHLSENNYIGIMLPYTPLHYLLFEEGIESLVMTSANLSDMPIMYDNEQALTELWDIADGFLLHNRDIVNRCDDSLLWVIEGNEYFVRRSRGYVPYPLTLPGAEGILACGAEQKASFTVSRDGYVFPGAHIGDLKNIETLDNYSNQIDHFQKLFDAQVTCVVSDMHPDYMSSVYAKERSEKEGCSLIKVQHHHAHMASCMADNNISEKCIGIVWDGTGLGSDGTIWGSEFLVGGYLTAARYASFKQVALAGGDKAVKEIFRSGIALLESAGIDSENFFEGEKADLVRKMLSADINCPRSSGMGRLFDGVSAILGICSQASYEGQGAVLLEACAQDDGGSYPFEIIKNAELPGKVCSDGSGANCGSQEDLSGTDRLDVSVNLYDLNSDSGKAKYIIDTTAMIRQIVSDLETGAAKNIIAGRFMNTLVQAAVQMCDIIREETGKNKVVLSGGSFQNMYMLKRIKAKLKDGGFEVFTHRRVSCNDEGISFGQCAVAASLIGSECN